MSNEEETARSALLRASTPPSTALFSSLITANHILHYHNVVDAFGHISVRNPQNPNTFFMSRDLAPALVTKKADLEEYRVEDASPVNAEAAKGYAERFIHSELYKKYPQIHSVIHAHAEAVLPFSISHMPLRPVFHMAGALGSEIPIYDISRHYTSADNLHSLLVNNAHLGESLARGFAPSSSFAKATSMVKALWSGGGEAEKSSTIEFPSHPVVLMRGHGFTCVGTGIEEAVYRAVYTCANARVQTTAALMQGSVNLGLVAARFGEKEEQPGRAGPAVQQRLRFLDDREVKDTWTQLQGHVSRPWKLWCAEVKQAGLYSNELGDPPGA